MNYNEGEQRPLKIQLKSNRSDHKRVFFFEERSYSLFNIINHFRDGSRISKGGVDGRPYLLRGGRENALTKKIGNNFSCTCLRRVF